jgi:spore maturation protein CgeB
MTFVFLGLSVTSSWGNGHATTYRSLLRALADAGHQVLFLERDVPWYAAHRDCTGMPGVQIELYASCADLAARFRQEVQEADVVIVGSYVPDGRVVAAWALETARHVVAFYDIDTPITLASLEAGQPCAYLDRALLGRFALYLSFAGGPTLERIARLGAPCVRPLYCSVDPAIHRPTGDATAWDLGYLGTYAADRQDALDQLLVQVALRRPDSRFVVAGSLYPADLEWPPHVQRIEHVPPPDHGTFYNRQRFTLNLTRADMRRLGFSPSVRLFEAAACGTVIISDVWEGLDTFFAPHTEILPATTADEVEWYLQHLPTAQRLEIGRRARARVLAEHTAAVRAAELVSHVRAASGVRPPVLPASTV